MTEHQNNNTDINNNVYNTILSTIIHDRCLVK